MEKLSSFVRVNVQYFQYFGGILGSTFNFWGILGGIFLKKENILRFGHRVQCPILKLSSWALAPRAQLGHKPEPRVNAEALVSGPIEPLELKGPWASAQCARWVNTALRLCPPMP